MPTFSVTAVLSKRQIGDTTCAQQVTEDMEQVFITGYHSDGSFQVLPQDTKLGKFGTLCRIKVVNLVGPQLVHI